jgi:hypothetical protein
MSGSNILIREWTNRTKGRSGRDMSMEEINESGYNHLDFEPDTISDRSNNKVQSRNISDIVWLAIVKFGRHYCHS